LAILRALSPGRHLGVAWWLFPDSGPVGDGRHTSYLDAPDKWRHLDPPLFDALKQVVKSDHRRVAALEGANVLPVTVYFSEMIPAGASPVETRTQREGWFARCQARLAGCDLIFLDPDNGLETKNFSLGSYKAGKSVSLKALAALRQTGRTLVVYHHHTHYAGGHVAELRYWADRLRAQGFERVDALRARPYSPRAFFLLDADDEMRERAAALARRWDGLISWHANGGVHPGWIGKAGDFQMMGKVIRTENHLTPAEIADNAAHAVVLAEAAATPNTRAPTHSRRERTDGQGGSPGMAEQRPARPRLARLGVA
jgi:hypothetical protein